MAKPKTVPVRVPDEMAASLKRVSSLNGITPGEQMARAFEWWWNRYGDGIVSDLGATVESMRPRPNTEP